MENATATPETMQRVSLDKIRVEDGFNPRKHFDEAALTSLTASVRAEGVIQPIILRPRGEDGFLYVVAGERRFRAAQAAGLPDIPAVVRTLTDRQAMTLAAVENSDRENISLAEEATLARKALDASEGDREQAAKMLNWTLGRLDGRLLLLNAHESVLSALMTKKIKVGHAELLSTLPDDVQAATLPSIIDKNVTVEDLRKRLASFTQELSAAPFPTEGCRGCPFNSSTQHSLFEFSVGAGRCSKKECWDGKTEAFLAAKKNEVATEVNVVFFDREKDPGSYVRLEMTGEAGVGEDQFKGGCQGCRNFGALICTRPGKEGRVAKDVCFDTPCNAKMQKAYQKSIAPPPDEPSEKEESGGARSARPGAKAKPKRRVHGAPAPKKITRLTRTFLRQTAAPLAATDPGVRSLMELLGLMALCKDVTTPKGLHNVSDYELTTTSCSDVRKLLEQWPTLTAEKIEEQKQALVKAFFSEKGENADEDDRHTGVHHLAAYAISATKTAIEGRFKLTKEFVEAHTKSGIGALMEEAEFWRSMPGDTDKAKKAAVEKLLTLKHGELVKAVVSSKHPIESFVPRSVRRAVEIISK